jgi:hypothetical protein
MKIIHKVYKQNIQSFTFKMFSESNSGIKCRYVGNDVIEYLCMEWDEDQDEFTLEWDILSMDDPLYEKIISCDEYKLAKQRYESKT